VFCGSSTEVAPHYLESARQVGALLAQRGIEVVYGGGSVGLMNAVADGAMAAGGRVIGVIPRKLMDLEVGRTELTELHVVEGMHARKALMAELSDAFIALPGGFGTFEELFEVTTWAQLNYHHKPVGALNLGGYYDHLEAFLAHAVAERFIRPVHGSLIAFRGEPSELLDALEAAVIPNIEDWLGSPNQAG
jgi:hypothetical protein